MWIGKSSGSGLLKRARFGYTSIIAAIFLPLGLLTGLLGINVGGIPGTESPWAFLVVTAVLVVIAAALVWLFKRIKWL